MGIDLNKLSKEIYEANKAKGFHDENNSKEHMLCLVISELMEAVEADRKGRKADLEHYADILSSPRHKYGINNDDWFHLFQHTIKDTVEDELADAVIRLLDTSRALGIQLKEIKKDNNFDYYEVNRNFTSNSFTENIFYIVSRYFTGWREVFNGRYSRMIFHIEVLCEVMNIDLWKHVELKLKYNSLRPYKHGKKY